MTDELDYYLSEARKGNYDAAYHGLIELPDVSLCDLEQAFQGEQNHAMRSLIVEAVWQHRLPSSVDFLAVALEDPQIEVRKKALDGLVTLASAESRRVLEMAKRRLAGDDASFGFWIEEAIDQIRESTAPGA